MKINPYLERSWLGDLSNLLRVMKITVLFLFIGISAAFSSTYSQTTELSLDLSQRTIADIFNTIEKQTEYVFFFSDEIRSELSKKVNIHVESKTIDHILNELFAGTNLTYKINDRQVSIGKSPEKKQTNTPLITTRELTGVVKDKFGDPIIGANIVVKGQITTGTITDIDGKFSLNVPDNTVLVVSYIGYKTQEIPVRNSEILQIVLEDDMAIMDEVVVVGYGTQKKVNLTGSIASVSTEDIKDRVQTNVLSSLQGTIPGVTIITRPGGGTSINFRGRGNLGTSEPLYVINGAIADKSFFSNLDPNSIESISFMKDAASSAIYGSRAAFGVVLVTTKTGKTEKFNISYNGYIGSKTPTYLFDAVNSWEYATLLNEGMYNRNPSAGKNQAYSEEEIGWFKDGSQPDYYPNTDWQDLVLDKHVLTTQHSLNFSGGGEKVSFFTGLGYLYDDNYMPGQSSQRYNLDMNVTANLLPWITLRTGVKYIQNTGKTEHGTAYIGNFIGVPSIMVAKHSNGEWGSIAGGKQATQSFMNWNPLRALSKNNWGNSKNERTLIDLAFDIKPFKGLTITGQGIYNGNESKSKSYTALQDNIKTFETGVEIPGTGVYTNEMNMHWTSSTRTLYTGMAHYEWSNPDHFIGILAGTSYEHYNYERLYMKRKDFATDNMKDIETGAEISKDVPNGAPLTENKMLSYFGRVNYSYLGRYLFEANLRADASSRFHKENRWGVFPSFSAGWRISEEEFMRSLEWLNNLKIRASWGTLGNINNVGNYDYFQSYNNGANYNFDDEPVKGVLESKPANVNLGWETITLTDFGIDVDLFNGKLGFTADYYIRKTGDILLGYNVPVETGISSKPSQNIGKLENKGFEFAITHRNQVGGFIYSVGANMAINSNKITDLGSSGDIIVKDGDKINYILREGEAVGSFYGYKTDGLYTQQEIDNGHYYTFGRKPQAGDIKYVPQRKNVEWGSAISGEDRTVIGKDVPDVTYGLNLNLQYKNFELSLFGQGVIGTSVAFESEQVSCFFLNSNPRKFHLKRWTEDNPNPHAAYPRIYGGSSMDDYNQYFSDYQIFDADYFRFKNISLGYRIPKSIISKWSLSDLKIFVTGENLFTIRADKDMKDFDPESAKGRGLGAFSIKSIALGVNVSF